MSTNHKPEIPDGSEAIWDRLRLIPFNQRFTGKDADTKLPAKLREEFAGILAWAVRGCVAWVEGGLGTSAAVDAATAEYRAETDVTQRFLTDRCVFGPEYRITRKGLFEAWEKWAIEEGVDSGTQTSFTKLISERAKTLKLEDKKAKGGTRYWLGIGLQSADPDPDLDQVPTPETPAKSQKTEEGRHFDENFQKVSTSPPYKGTSAKKSRKSADLPTKCRPTPNF
jgi:putative DNA primase/helicase